MSKRMLVCLLLLLPTAIVGCGKKSTLPADQQAMADEIKDRKGICGVTAELGVMAVNLQGTDADDAFVKRLSVFPNLQRLSLRATKITDESVPALVKMKELRVLDVGDTKLTEKGKAAIREAFPEIALSGAEEFVKPEVPENAEP